MAQAPASAPAKHNHEPAPRPTHEAAKTVGQPGSLILPEAEPALGEPLIGAMGVKGEHIEDGERDPDTIAEEQRRRSDEYVSGMAARGDTRRADDRPAAHAPPPKK